MDDQSLSKAGQLCIKEFHFIPVQQFLELFAVLCLHDWRPTTDAIVGFVLAQGLKSSISI